MESAGLLKNRLTLSWGGYRLADASELEYRILKAAAKKKDATTVEKEYLSHPSEVRAEVIALLRERWQISASENQEVKIVSLLEELRCRFKQKRSILTPNEIVRIFSRIRHPAGMLVITGKERHVEISNIFSAVFSPLYFRDAESSAMWALLLLPKLVRTRLLLVPSAGAFWVNFVPSNCRFVVAKGETTHETLLRFAITLEHRCKSRERPI